MEHDESTREHQVREAGMGGVSFHLGAAGILVEVQPVASIGRHRISLALRGLHGGTPLGHCSMGKLSPAGHAKRTFCYANIRLWGWK